MRHVDAAVPAAGTSGIDQVAPSRRTLIGPNRDFLDQLRVKLRLEADSSSLLRGLEVSAQHRNRITSGIDDRHGHILRLWLNSPNGCIHRKKPTFLGERLAFFDQKNSWARVFLV